MQEKGWYFCQINIKSEKTKQRRNQMITLQDVRENSEVESLIIGSQKQLDELRLYRTWA